MSDDPSAQTPSSDPRPVPTAPAPVKSQPRRQSSGPGLLFPLLTLVSLMATAGVGYLYLQQSAQLASVNATVAILQAGRSDGSAEIAALQAAQQQLGTSLREELRAEFGDALQQTLQQQRVDIEQQLTSANARLQAQTVQLDAMGRELVSVNQRIRQSSSGTNQDWLLAEAESLLHLAQQYLMIAGDVRTASALFTVADERLRNSSNPAVFAVREVLARELSTLQALPTPDVQGLYVQLGAHSEQVDLLAVDSGTDTDFNVPSREAAVTDGWVANAMDALGQYFVVTKRDQAVTPLMTAEQEYLIRRSVQLQIEQARLALLQREDTIYRAALDAALTAIASRLQEQDGRRAALITALAALRDTPISVDIPQVNATLEALQRVEPGSPAAPDGAAQ